jgi:hypothetical protein
MTGSRYGFLRVTRCGCGLLLDAPSIEVFTQDGESVLTDPIVRLSEP